MVKYLAMVAAVVGSLMIAEQAQARHGCRSCGGGGYAAGGCPGGTCAVSYGAPAKMATTNNAPPGFVTTPAPAPAVVTAQPTRSNYVYTPARRGLFGRR